MGKQQTMISLDEGLKKKCKDKGINISKSCNNYLLILCGEESEKQKLLEAQNEHMSELYTIQTQLKALDQEGLKVKKDKKVEKKDVNEAVKKLMNNMAETGTYDPEIAEQLAKEYNTTADFLFNSVMERMDGD